MIESASREGGSAHRSEREFDSVGVIMIYMMIIFKYDVRNQAASFLLIFELSIAAMPEGP